MKFMNVVKFRVKKEELETFKELAYKEKSFDGMIHEYYVQTSAQDFVAVGLWESEDKLGAARPEMIAFLDKMRPLLEELSPELGVTDPVSGPIMFSA